MRKKTTTARKTDNSSGSPATGRHRTAERQRESEDTFRALFENSPSVIWEMDCSGMRAYLDGRGIARVRDYERYFKRRPDVVAGCVQEIKAADANRAALRLYRARSKKQLLSSVQRCIPPSSVNDVIKGVCAVLGGDTSFSITTVHRTLRGAEMPVTLKWQLLPGSERTWERVIVTVEDITASVAARRELQAARDRAERYLNVAASIIVGLDARGRITMLNGQGARMLGCDRTAVIGKSWFANFIPPRIRRRMRDVFRRMMAGGPEPLEYYDNDVMTAAGEILTVHWHNTLLKDADGRITGILSSGEDVTAARQSENELKWELTVHNALSGMARMLVSPNNTMRAICEITLQYARGITGCAHGFAAVIDPETRDAVRHAFTRTMPGRPDWAVYGPLRIPVRPDGTYAGLQGHALNERRGFYTNAPAAHPAASRGTPDAHVPYRNYLAVPALADFTLYGEIALADAPQDLAERDLLALEQLGHLFALAVQRLRSTEALQESERKYRELFTNMQSAFGLHRIITDDEGTPVDFEFVDVNGAFERLVHRKRDELIGNRLTETLPDAARDSAGWIERFGRIARGCGQEQFEYYSKKNDRWYFVTTYCPKPGHFAVIYDDMTGFKKAQADLAEKSAFLESIFSTAPAGIGVVTDRVITDVNATMEAITGYERDELTGRNVRMLYPSDEDCGYADFDRYRRTSARVTSTVETRMVRKDGRVIDVLLSSTPLDPAGGRRGIVFSVLDITEKNRAAADIARSLKEKDILLKEVHHRVKNNMQVISSLLNLQSEYLRDENTKRMLEESRDRIRSMSLVHEQLYRTGDFARLDVGQYLSSLVRGVARTYYRAAELVRTDVRAHGITMPVTTAIPCGLIVNELVSNAFKHAFPDGRSGAVGVTMERTSEGTLRLTVRDDGAGLPAGFDYETARSLGLRLVVMLARHQLDGTLDVERDHGTAVTVTFNGEQA